jgi:CO/xanthine dehydrogenase Mo-binding subunit
MSVTRREFVKGTGALLVGIVAPVSLVDAQSARLSPSLAKNPQLAAWIRITRDGLVSVYPGKCELGQGISTALAQIVADELDVALARVRMQPVDTETSPDEAYTFSSISIQHSGSALRQVAAEVRHVLLQNAVTELGVPLEILSVEDGAILADGARSGLSYRNLLENADFDVDVSGDIAPKRPQDYRYVGSDTARLDIPAKVFGEESFIQDVRLPGMLHARMVRPALQNQELSGLDESAVRAMPGVRTIVRDGSFLAVVAEREEQAIAAAEALRGSASWKGPAMHPPEKDLPLALRRVPVRDYIVHETNDATAEAARTFTRDYSRPFTAHASISPAAALAHWDGGRLTVWSHGQGMFPLRGAIARVTGIDESRIQLKHREAAGCYGHNGADDAACDAAIIALNVPDTPIRLQWSRHDEFRYEPMGSAMSIRLTAGLDGENNLTHWHYDVWSGTHSGRPFGAPAAGNLRAAREIEESIAQPQPRSIPQPAGGADRNGLPLYRFPNQKISKHLVQSSPLYVSALRGLGAYANIFAIEAFVEELAAATGEHPLEFRLRYLEDQRARAVLESLRTTLDSAAESPGRDWMAGRGLGFAKFKNLSAYVGVVCEVHLNKRTGELRVNRAFATVDAGMTVSPDGLRNQIEGGIVQSASWTLMEAVHYGDVAIQSRDWATYPIMRFSEVPEVSVQILDDEAHPSLGAGEAAQGPTAADITNAVTAATGARIRDLPLTRERILSALG